MDNITPERQILKEINRVDMDSGKKLPKNTEVNTTLIGDHSNIVTGSDDNFKTSEENINTLNVKSILPDILIAPTTPRQITAEASLQSIFKQQNDGDISTFGSVDSGINATVSFQRNNKNITQPDIQNDLNQSSDDESFMECRSFNDTTNLNETNNVLLPKRDYHDNVMTITTTNIDRETLVVDTEETQQQHQHQETTFVDSTSTVVTSNSNNNNNDTEQTYNASSDFSMSSEPTVIFLNDNTITQQSEITSSNNLNNNSIDDEINTIDDSPQNNVDNENSNLISVIEVDSNEIMNLKEKHEHHHGFGNLEELSSFNNNNNNNSCNSNITSTNTDELKSLEYAEDDEAFNSNGNVVMINDASFTLNKTLDSNDNQVRRSIDFEEEVKRCDSSFSCGTPVSTERSVKGVDLIPSNEEINISRDLHIDLSTLDCPNVDYSEGRSSPDLKSLIPMIKSPSEYELNISQTLSEAVNIDENLNETIPNSDIGYEGKSETCFNTTITLEDETDIKDNDAVSDIGSSTSLKEIDDNYFARNIFPVESSKLKPIEISEEFIDTPVESMDWEECFDNNNALPDNKRLSVRQDLFLPQAGDGNNPHEINKNVKCSSSMLEDKFVENLNKNFDITFKKPKTPKCVKSSPTLSSDVGNGNDVKCGDMSFPFGSTSRACGNDDDFATFPDDEFKASNGLIFKQSDFDFLLTKGNNKLPDDRSSLLLQFDPLVGLRQFPQQKHLQQVAGTTTTSSSSSPVTGTVTTAQNNNKLLFPTKLLSPTIEETFIDSGCGGSNISCVSNVTFNENNNCEVNLNETLPIGDGINKQVELNNKLEQQQQRLVVNKGKTFCSVIKQEKQEVLDQDEEVEEKRSFNYNNNNYIIGNKSTLTPDKVVDKTNQIFNQKGHDNTTMSVDCIQDMKVGNDVKSSFDNNMSVEQDEKQEYKMAELEKKIKNEVLKTEDIEKKLKEAETREETLLKRITEKDKCIAKLSGVMEAYEKAIAELISEKEQIGKNYENKCSELAAARDLNLQHLTSLETTFSDLNAKYERSKQKTTALVEAKELLLQEKQQNLENLWQQEQRYEKLKGHAMTQLEIANNKLDNLAKNHAQEITRLKALLKKEEVSRLSIKEQLQQKSRENEELVKICDELIGGSSSS